MEDSEPTTDDADVRFFFSINRMTGLVVDCDNSLLASTGLTIDEVIGTSWPEHVYHEDRKGILMAGAQVAEQGRCRWTCRLLHGDGSPVSYHVDAVLGTDNETVYMWAQNAEYLAKSQADLWQYQRLSDLADDLFLVTDVRGNVVTVNRATVETHGGRREDYPGRSVASFLPPEGQSILNQIFERFLAGERSIDFVMPAYNRDGEIIMIEGRTTFDKSTQRWYTVERDATKRLAREAELTISQRFFDLSSSHLALIGDDGRILRANPAFIDMVSSPGRPSPIGSRLTEVLQVRSRDMLATALSNAHRNGDYANVTADVKVRGRRRTLAVTLMPSAEGGSVFFSSRDITEEQRLASELLDRATRDQLTRLANREVFNENLDTVLASGFSAAVIMLDLDDFKRVNDSLGHSVGDELLAMAGNRIVTSIRPDDLVARFGGDEFVILLSGTEASADAEMVAEKIRLALAKPFVIEGRALHVTTSLGVAVGSSITHTASQLCREADAAAYEAKRSGRNCSRFFNADLQRSIERQQKVETELRWALDNDGIDVDAQCLFSNDGTVLGVEALARLMTSSGDRLPPDRFVDIARQLGLLSEVGEQVFDRTLAALGPWLNANPQMSVSINADPSEIGAPGFAEMVERLSAQHSIDPRQLVIEVTESGFIAPGRTAAKVLQHLRRLGIRIAIDDFGTGASSLGYLRDLRVDQVKIDRSFIQEMASNSVAKSITEAVIGLGRELGIEVVAEGIEQESDLRQLHELECPTLQGFLLHRPTPIDSFVEDIRSDGGQLDRDRPFRRAAALDQTIFESDLPQ